MHYVSNKQVYVHSKRLKHSALMVGSRMRVPGREFQTVDPAAEKALRP